MLRKAVIINGRQWNILKINRFGTNIQRIERIEPMQEMAPQRTRTTDMVKN